jgi:hypothetical protein
MSKSRYHIISHACAAELLYSQRVRGNGRVICVSFRRRTDRRDLTARKGDRESVIARFNVRKGLKSYGDGWQDEQGNRLPSWRPGARPIGAAYDRYQHLLVCIYIMARIEGDGPTRCFRSIPLDQIEWLKLDGVRYRVGCPAPVQH